MYEKLKGFIADDALFFSVLIILVGVSSFGLGRLSQDITRIDQIGAERRVTISEDPAVSAVIEERTVPATEAVLVVASKNGTKYHLPSCPGAKQISEKNKITFENIPAAEAAGYGPAANCKF